MTRSIPSLLCVLAMASCAVSSDPDTQGEFPVYGNWCGPGHPKEGTNPAPINQTDEACRIHDVCYQRHGYFNTVCDKNLIQALGAIQTDDPLEDVARQGIMSYFQNASELTSQ